MVIMYSSVELKDTKDILWYLKKINYGKKRV